MDNSTPLPGCKGAVTDLTLSVRVRRTGDTTSFSETTPNVEGSAGPKKSTWRHIFAHPCA